MRFLLRLGSYVFHPLIVPILCWLFYILAQPMYPKAMLFQLSYKDMILFTLIIPALIWCYLKLRKKISDWNVTEMKQRRIPLLLYALCLIILLYLGRLDFILPIKAFIYGMLCTVITSWMLLYIKVKASLHQAAISGLLLFAICLSIFLKLNLLFYIGILIFANGWVASSRLYLKRHTPTELLLGFLIGALPQLYLVSFWL